MKKILLITLFVSFSIWSQKIETKIICDTIIHKNYDIFYSKQDNVPLYVNYDLYPDRVKNVNNFFGFFVKDPKYKNTILPLYKNSDYDRGHLFPAEDASFDKETFTESYYDSNIAPQKIGFNRGIWKRLEKLTRTIAEKDSLTIITGCDIYSENNLEIFTYLKNKIKIPNYYFKIIINYTKNTIDIYYIPNKYCYGSLSKYLININTFEEKTGIIIENIF